MITRRQSAKTARLAEMALCVAGMLLAGCGRSDVPELAAVSGTVTLNGTPLADAAVQFVPVNGRPSSGRTNSSGEYSLMYNDDADGCLPGPCRVLISTGSAGEENDDGEIVGARNETVPPQYNVQSMLTFDVKPGTSNEANFELTGVAPAATGNAAGTE